jgi:hypothetical protein
MTNHTQTPVLSNWTAANARIKRLIAAGSLQRAIQADRWIAAGQTSDHEVTPEREAAAVARWEARQAS